MQCADERGRCREESRLWLRRNVAGFRSGRVLEQQKGKGRHSLSYCLNLPPWDSQRRGRHTTGDGGEHSPATSSSSNTTFTSCYDSSHAVVAPICSVDDFQLLVKYAVAGGFVAAGSKAMLSICGACSKRVQWKARDDIS